MLRSILLCALVLHVCTTAVADDRLAGRIGMPKDFHPQVEAYKADHGGRAPSKADRRKLLEDERLYELARPWGQSPEAAGMMGLSVDGKPLAEAGSRSRDKPAGLSDIRARRIARAAARRAIWGG